MLLIIPDYLFTSQPDDKPYSIGVFVGGSYIWNKTEIPILSADGGCGTFQNGNAIGYFGRLDFSYMVMDNFLYAGVNLMYDHRPVTLTSICTRFQVYHPALDEYVDLKREYTYDGYLDYTAFGFGVKIKPMEYLPLYFSLTFDAGLPVISTNYTLRYEIVSPAGVTDPVTNTNKVQVGKGKINGAGLSAGVSLGASGEFPVLRGLTDDLYLNPFIAYRYGLNSIQENDKWNVNLFRAGIGLSYEFGSSKKETPMVKPPPPPPPEPEKKPVPKKPVTYEKPKPKAIISFRSQPLVLSKTVVTQTYPLLPYIFFDSASSSLRDRYMNNDIPHDNFEEMELPKSTLRIYYHILDIVGHRMSEDPNSNLRITGVTDGSELPEEEQRLKLGRERAKAAAEYLTDKWGIRPERIITDARNMPELATNMMYREGYEENRRVELSSDDPMLLAPVIHTRFNEYASKNNSFIFNTKTNDSVSIRKWEINIFDGDSLFRRESGEGRPPVDISSYFDYDFIMGLGRMTDNRDSLRCVLSVFPDSGTPEKMTAYTSVQKIPENFEVGRLNLIVFDFDKSDISAVNKAMIKDFIRNSIHDNSITRVTGSTDRLGSYDYNLNLSLSRARNVADYVEKLKPGIAIKDVKGTGSSVLPYDNNLPEGRFYCRTVMVELRTPLMKK